MAKRKSIKLYNHIELHCIVFFYCNHDNILENVIFLFIDFVFMLFILIARMLYMICEIIVSKSIKVEVAYRKLVIIIWRKRNNTTYCCELNLSNPITCLLRTKGVPLYIIAITYILYPVFHVLTRITNTQIEMHLSRKNKMIVSGYGI